VISYCSDLLCLSSIPAFDDVAQHYKRFQERLEQDNAVNRNVECCTCINNIEAGHNRYLE
jgi:hypothetical protein